MATNMEAENPTNTEIHSHRRGPLSEESKGLGQVGPASIGGFSVPALRFQEVRDSQGVIGPAGAM